MFSNRGEKGSEGVNLSEWKYEQLRAIASRGKEGRGQALTRQWLGCRWRWVCENLSLLGGVF